jgi:hypothetical protein
MLTELVFKGSSNKINVIVSEDGIPVNFVAGGVTRMELYIGGVIVTSDTSRLNFFDEGKIELSLGDIEALSSRVKYSVYLKIYTLSDPLGEMIIHPKLRNSNMSLEVVDSKI